MAVMRIHKSKDYTVMSNRHFREKKMSLKAKGLLSLMFSLPDDWDYSISGLAAICKENETAIKSTLNELKEFGYLSVTKKMPNETESGRIEYIYDIYEQPVEKQEEEKQGVENLGVENQGQLNTNKPNTKKLSTNYKKEIDKEKPARKKFIPPTLEEVKAYCTERHNNVDYQQFFDFYNAGDWVDNKGNKVKNWKQKVITWEKSAIRQSSTTSNSITTKFDII